MEARITMRNRVRISGLGEQLRYLFVLSRPRFWLYLAGPVVVGVTYAAGSVAELFSVPALLLFGYFVFPANVLLYGVNDVFDADIDISNPKKGGREARWRGNRAALWSVIGSAAVGLVTVAVTPPVAWPYLAGFFLLAVGYSAPPLRFKTSPGLDSLSNGLYILPGAAAYAAIAGSHPPLAALAGAWLWTMGMHTFSAIPDIEPDRTAGIQTTATVLGKRLTYVYCFIIWTLAAVGFAALDPRMGLLIGVYPVFVAVVVGRSVSVDRAYWWFPAVNTGIGTVLTMAALWMIVPPSALLPSVMIPVAEQITGTLTTSTLSVGHTIVTGLQAGMEHLTATVATAGILGR
ncbi:MAG: lycopene elongase [uncultured archaeon A07HR60]|nr:MAG: lycopene elongase [uncultured archaeon A07HR60]